MAVEETKSMTESDGKKLWVFWVFGLGFFAGFLVALVVADKLKAIKPGAGHEEKAAEVAPEQHEPAHAPIEEEPVRAPTAHDGTQEVTMTKAMRDRLLTLDFLKLLQDAEIHRYRHEGEMKGIVLTKIRTGSIYEKVGFADGDIIEQINGIALADMEKRAGEMREKLPGADVLEFRVRRDDKIQKIRVRVVGQNEQ